MQADSGRLQRVAARPEDIADDVVQIGDDASVYVAFPRHRQQIFDDRRSANGLVIDGLERAAIFDWSTAS